MQTVWSRIAQTRGTCCCPQCLHSGTAGVSRRATGSATRRAPKFLTSSTLWYSGIFAAAATFDAGVKQQRREQWDKAIAEVKQELGQTTEQATQDAKKTEPEAVFPSGRGDALDALAEVADVFSEVEPSRRRALWPANTGPPLQVHRLPPESIYATDVRREQAALRRWTPKKVEAVMLSIDALQLKIFYQLAMQNGSNWRTEASAAIPVNYRDQMFMSAEELLAAFDSKSKDLARLKRSDPELNDWQRSEQDMPLCSYSQDDQGLFHGTTRELNKSLQALFKQHTASTITTPALLAKVAYNLSISAAPPNVHTYNTLLLGFSKAQQPILVSSTIHSLRRTSMRPNEVTNSAILNHYTAQDDAEGFIKWIKLMRGKNGGLALARPDIRINEAGADRLIRDEERGRPDRVIQLPYPTPNVFSAIIRGMLKFSGFDTALGICERMGQEGWGLCMSGLTPLLKDCARHGDWESGLAVSDQIQALKKKSTRRQGKTWVSEVVGLDAYAAMLRLCSRAGQRDKFEIVWQQACRAHQGRAGVLKEIVEYQQARPNAAVAAQSELWEDLAGNTPGDDSRIVAPDIRLSKESDMDAPDITKVDVEAAPAQSFASSEGMIRRDHSALQVPSQEKLLQRESGSYPHGNKTDTTKAGRKEVNGYALSIDGYFEHAEHSADMHC
ncbi:hypothetical protein D0862_00242 [Hortaea werneckii]|uniref:Pentatricopeptide repeat domain-containing protein n=1 Tax=Hortaea werneckii TaxID=91943 RepID=A0A3M7HZH4_HORWE|nr:hypothetical protein D0862_00242 [Hortaea werneckii]